MRVRVLGSATGGEYPQWNCNHPNSGVRSRSSRAGPNAIGNCDSHYNLISPPPAFTFRCAARRAAAPPGRAIDANGDILMWSTPVVREIAVGLEINCYACADL